MWSNSSFPREVMWPPLTCGPLSLAAVFDCPTMQQGWPQSQIQFSQQLGVKEGLTHSCSPPPAFSVFLRAVCVSVNMFWNAEYFNVHILLLRILKVTSIHLNPLCCVHRYDFEDEMEPEIEEAFEHFCLESERKRQQWRESEESESLKQAYTVLSHSTCRKKKKKLAFDRLRFLFYCKHFNKTSCS